MTVKMVAGTSDPLASVCSNANDYDDNVMTSIDYPPIVECFSYCFPMRIKRLMNGVEHALFKPQSSQVYFSPKHFSGGILTTQNHMKVEKETVVYVYLTVLSVDCILIQ